MKEGQGGLIERLQALLSTNAELQGSVTTGQATRDRIEEIVHTVTGGGTGAQELAKPDTSDRYGGTGRTVSIEGEASKQVGLQQALDQHVVDENLGISHHDSQGLQPCQRVSKGES